MRELSENAWVSREMRETWHVCSSFITADVILTKMPKSIYSKYQISTHLLINKWDISTSSFKKQMSPMLELFFGFRSRPYHRYRYFILYLSTKFHSWQSYDAISTFKMNVFLRIEHKNGILCLCLCFHWSKYYWNDIWCVVVTSYLRP